MDFALTEEQRMLFDSVSGFLNSAAPLEHVREAAQTGATHSTDIAQGLAQLGVYGILIDPDYGGVGLGMLEAALVAEALGYAVAPAAFAGTAVMAPMALQLAGSDEQKEMWPQNPKTPKPL